MPGTKLPAVRLPSSLDEEGGVPTPVVVELPTSSKFGFAWPAEPPPPVQTPLNSERAVSLSSSEGDSELSDVENTYDLHSQTDHSDQNDPTPMNRSLKSGQQALVDKLEKGPTHPKLSRAASMPLPSRLGHLQNPRRPSHSSHPSNTPSSQVTDVPPEHSQFHELSLELADSVQMMVQTLLQISPSQVFDPAKEQFSACSLSIPTPCMSAVFTSMKNLNYISANMAAFCADPDFSRDPGRLDPSFVPSTTPGAPSTIPNDFDIGELLQSVGDTLSGAAAQAGVDLVLYHGDVGMKHVCVKGDECGISYALSHIIRQVIGTAGRGDSIEIGLFVGPSRSKSQAGTDPNATLGSENPPPSPVLDSDGPLSCSFDIAHNFVSSDASSTHDASQGLSQSLEPLSRPPPTFNMVILQRLLRQVGASLACDLQPKSFAGGRACELTVTLERAPSAVNARAVPPPEDVTYQLLSGVRIAEEPTLEELAQFAETLRGKKVTLYASSKGSFAHHLTSYLTAWGMDVTHVSAELGVDGNTSQVDSSLSGTPSVTEQRTLGGTPLQSTPFGAGLEAFSQAIPLPTPLPAGSAELRPTMTNTLSFIFIDDDVVVLRERLRKLRLQQAYPLTLSRKRPSLAPHHRPRSSPHVQRAAGTGTTLPVVIVHFTSLTNYKLVKDVIQSDLASCPGSTSAIPEVMIIPKPAGPRRFLTALHTAVTKPIVDPFFAPIATSPITTGQTSFFNINTPHTRTPSPKSPTSASRPSRTNSDRSTKSPKEILVDPVTLPPPSPLSISDSMEYFSEAAAKLGASPSSGLVIQSPSGQPAGIFFHPKGKGKSSVVMERERGQFLVPSEQIKATTARRTPNGKEPMSPHSPHSPMTFSSLHTASIIPTSTPLVDIASQESQPASIGPFKPKGKKPSSPRTEDTPILVSSRRASAMSSNNVAIKVITPPTSPLNETVNASAPPPRRNSRRPTTETKQPGPQAGVQGPVDANIVVPPISVLIVDDNPINQTILSTFMKKKKIKYDVAKNGEEAVQKWRTGGFHLILMDIQMPVMDGIQATKEIRLMEKMSSSSEFPLSSPRSDGALRTPPLRTPSEAPSSSTSTSSPYRSSVIIVALTASSLQSDRVAALAAGCNDFLTKPVSLQWLNNKIIEWGSIKALQMWADLRPEVVKSISTGQAAQAHNVARRLHVPEGRSTPTGSPSRSLSRPRTTMLPDAPPTSIEPSSPVPSSSAQAPHFPTKDDFSDSPSSDNPASDSEPRRPALSGVATAMTITDLPLSIPSARTTAQPLNADDDALKQDDELPSTLDEKSVIPFI